MKALLEIMIFNAFDRGVLELLFEESINNMQVNVDLARSETFDNLLNDKDGVDLALGLALGVIQTSFIAGFKIRNNRHVNSDEKIELKKIIEGHLAKLKKAIFQCG